MKIQQRKPVYLFLNGCSDPRIYCLLPNSNKQGFNPSGWRGFQVTLISLWFWAERVPHVPSAVRRQLPGGDAAALLQLRPETQPVRASAGGWGAQPGQPGHGHWAWGKWPHNSHLCQGELRRRRFSQLWDWLHEIGVGKWVTQGKKWSEPQSNPESCLLAEFTCFQAAVIVAAMPAYSQFEPNLAHLKQSREEQNVSPLQDKVLR